MSDKTTQISARAETLNKIRRRVFDRMQTPKFDSRDEEIAYLLGIVDTLTKGIEWQAN